MRVIEIAKPNAPFELVERPTPEPGPRQARIKVEACGICHSDVFAATGDLSRRPLSGGAGP